MLLWILRLFVPKKETILFSSFSGRQYSDSPKYISEYLLKTHPELKQIWAFNDPEKFSDVLDKSITIVRFKSLRFILEALSCRVYVDNVEFWSALIFSKKQLVVETWHGGGAYKRVGQDRLDISKPEKNHVKRKMNKINLFLSSSRAFTQFVLKGSYNYEGEILECGLPRNDILFNYNSEKVKSIKDRLKISDSLNIVLYAPTFRKSLSKDIYDLDFSEMIKALENRFGGNWVILTRLHYYLQNTKINNSNVIDVTNYPDMQELLIISNILITDYSSSIWDMALLRKPCFLYTPDINDYCHERNFYTPIESWGAPYAATSAELAKKIKAFDNEKYLKDTKNYMDSLQCFDNGTATSTISERIVLYIRGK